MAYSYRIDDLVIETKEQTTLLKDMALSLKVLSGRKTLKELRLEQKFTDLNRRLGTVSGVYPKMTEEQAKVLKEMDEVRKELRKERGEE